MKEMQRVKGYGHPEPAHTSPIFSLRQLQDKSPKHQSLVQKCMKSLIKEKMSGCLINAARKKKEYEQNNNNRQASEFNSSSFTGVTKFLNGSITKARYQDPENLTPISCLNEKHSRHQSTLASINQRLTKISDYRNRLSILQVNKSQTEKIKKSVLVETKKNVDVSFISAIDHQDDDNSLAKGIQSPNFNGNAESKIGTVSVRLPEIKNRNNKYSMASLISPTSIVKSLLKKSADYNINQNFWKFLTGQSEGKQRLRKFSTSISDLNSPTAMPNSKQIKSSLFKPTVPSSSRENFLRYMAELPPPFGRLLQFVISFFEIKIPQELSALFYSSLLEDIKLVNQRAWSVAAFVFWDFNRDGVINSSDIFSIFKEFNHFESRGSNQEAAENIQNNPVKEKEKAKKLIKHQRNANREIISGTDNMMSLLKELKPKEEVQSQPQLDDKEGKRSDQISFKQSILNLENIQRALADFKQQLSRLNQQLSSKQFQILKIEDYISPNDMPILYLEQVVLTQANLKYKQVLPLFSAGGGNTNNSQGERLDVFPKNLNVKSCSSYRQCFISTEHNEETRMGREKIEEYKQELKNIRERKNRMLESKAKHNPKILKELNYVKVAGSEMGQTIKDIVLNLLGCLE